MKTHPNPFPETPPPADGEEAATRMRTLFAECERSALRNFARAEADGLDFDMRCAYAMVANRMARAAAVIAAGMGQRAESVHRIIVERV